MQFDINRLVTPLEETIVTRHGQHLIVDNFYRDPDEVRLLARSLKFQYRTDAVTYPGRESSVPTPGAPDIHKEIVERYINSYLAPQGHITAESKKKKRFNQGKFRVATERDNKFRPDGVHQDFQKWTGIVYLTPDMHCEGGFDLYEHKATKALSAQDPAYQIHISEITSNRPQVVHDYLIHEHMRNWSNWTKIDHIPMKDNRLVVAMAHCFHATGTCFGRSLNEARLSQHFEFYSDTE